jgi:hypothetical protein
MTPTPASDLDHRYWRARTRFVLVLTLEQIFFNKVCYGITRGGALLFSCFQLMRLEPPPKIGIVLGDRKRDERERLWNC